MRPQTWRTLSRVLLMVLVVIHLITWYVLRIEKLGSIGIEAFFAGLSQGVINTGFVFWIIIFLSALLLGRAFCGWFCWFGGFQDLVAWGIGDRFQFKIPRHILLYLGAIPFVSLGLKIYYTWIINWLDGTPSSFSFNLAYIEPWGGQQTGISILITLILYGPVLIYVFGRRAWCRHLCPIGALLKVFSTIRPFKVRLVNDKCRGCGICTRVCDMEINVPGQLAQFGEVRDTNCIVCLKCIECCPTQSLAFSTPSNSCSIDPAAISLIRGQSTKRRKAGGFDLTINLLWVTIVLVFSALGLRQNAPQEIKTLMTPGALLLIYVAALAIKATIGKLRSEDLE